MMIGCVGCVASHQSVVEDVNVEWWGDGKVLKVNNMDSTTLRDIEIFVRYYPTMAPDSLALIVDITTPDSLKLRERLTMYLDKGGSDRSESYITQRVYRRNVVWSEFGEYTIGISPVSVYRGIEAVGINTIKSN